MPTWENELCLNSLWLDTSNPQLNILKKFDPVQNQWIPASPTTAEEVGTYSATTIDDKIASLRQSGSTSNRPAQPTVGMVFFDTTLGKPIWCKNTSPITWVDSTGAIV